MVRYLIDLMEDATDFSWSSAKAAYAVRFSDKVRGILRWGNTDKIDRIRRANAHNIHIRNKIWQNLLLKVKSHDFASNIRQTPTYLIRTM